MNKTVKNILLKVSMLVGVSVFISLAVMAKINRDESRVEKVRINIDEWNGNFFINKAQVLDFVENKFEVKGRIVSGKDLEEIENAIRQVPQVKEANAYTDDKGNLNISIIQRKPLLRVYNLQGESFYIDENGYKFPVSPYYAARVPIINGNISEGCSTGKKIQSVELKRIYNVARNVNANKTWRAMIGQYSINEKKQVEMVPRFGNCTVLLGDEKNILQKLKRLDIFYFDVLKKVGWNYYRVINIMYKDQVVCLK